MHTHVSIRRKQSLVNGTASASHAHRMVQWKVKKANNTRDRDQPILAAVSSEGLALPRVSHSGEIALAGSRRLRSTLAVAPVLFAHAVVAKAKICRIISPIRAHQYYKHATITRERTHLRDGPPLYTPIRVLHGRAELELTNLHACTDKPLLNKVSTACAKGNGAAASVERRRHEPARTISAERLAALTRRC